ncbi:hypothetical protein ABT116_44700 [Streptomyces sp. NPDC002130]|uniref:hypothetical protein n=1 Tax=Streptomyces sp. NPDC002130 TaxID=3155568 RepID=UPI00332BAD3A
MDRAELGDLVGAAGLLPALERAEQAAAADLAIRHEEPVDAETVDVTALGDGERVDETAIDRSDEVQALFAEEGQ